MTICKLRVFVGILSCAHVNLVQWTYEFCSVHMWILPCAHLNLIQRTYESCPVHLWILSSEEMNLVVLLCTYESCPVHMWILSCAQVNWLWLLINASLLLGNMMMLTEKSTHMVKMKSKNLETFSTHRTIKQHTDKCKVFKIFYFAFTERNHGNICNNKIGLFG